MITFLPTRVFTVCAKSLDDARLVSQVSEAKTILAAILDKRQVGQPAFDMWRKHPGHLAIYGKIMADEHHIRFGVPRSEQRFFVPQIPDWFWRLSAIPRDLEAPIQQVSIPWDSKRDPPWLGDRRLHLSHIRQLYRKDRTYYKRWATIDQYPFQPCCVGCDYWWPTHAGVI